MNNTIKKLKFDEIKSSRPSFDELSKTKRFPVSVLLEDIRSLYNVGSIFRTSDGSLIERLYLCGYTGCPPRKEIEKTALGSTESVPWEKAGDPVEVVKRLRGKGYQIVSLEHADTGVPYNKAEYRFPLCLIMGNEVDGVSEKLVSMSDMAIEIPMHGIKQSLNVSVAYGVAIYTIINQI